MYDINVGNLSQTKQKQNDSVYTLTRTLPPSRFKMNSEDSSPWFILPCASRVGIGARPVEQALMHATPVLSPMEERRKDERMKTGSRLLLPRFRHQRNKGLLIREEGGGTGESSNIIDNNKIKINNKSESKASFPHTYKHNINVPGLSSLIFHCHHSSFNSSVAPS